MGFQTVVMLLNDRLDFIARSPKSVIWLLTHPAQAQSQIDPIELAEKFGEECLHPQAMKIMPYFHADGVQFYIAGGNRIDACQIFTKHEKRGTVELVLPDTWRDYL